MTNLTVNGLIHANCSVKQKDIALCGISTDRVHHIYEMLGYRKVYEMGPTNADTRNKTVQTLNVSEMYGMI